jgi:TM2 domain-containing membrane protein YozV
MSKGLSRRYKSLLLSALVFPGVGHLYLKRYGRGGALMAIALAGLAVIVVTMVEKTMVIWEKLQHGDLPPDADAIRGLLDQSTMGHAGLLLDITGYVVLLCWLFGMIDSYRIGKRQDASGGGKAEGLA